MVALSTHDLVIGYRHGKHDTVIMDGLDLELKPGRLTALLGANGKGKSTLMRTLAGSQPRLSGHIEYAGRDIDTLSRKELSRMLSLVYTDRTQAGGLTVKELVSLGRQPYTGFFGRLDDKDRDVVDSAMSASGIRHKQDCFLAELSDGERQKAMIAKVLAQETPVIMLDEPTAFLDVASKADVVKLLHSLAHDNGKAVLLSTHDISQALLLADELWIITADRQILQGFTEDMILDGVMQKMWDGGSARFNMSIGDFDVDSPIVSSVSLDCRDMQLRHWICNALRRNGVGVADNCDIHVEVRGKNEIIKTYGGRQTVCGSIRELIESI